MIPFKSGKTCNSLESNSNQDLISNLPDIVIDKIFKCLPLKSVAKMSILSKKWREIWLSHKYLVFDEHFWVELGFDDTYYESAIRSGNCIISRILFHHVGPIYKFYLHIPDCECSADGLIYDGWVSLLSKVGVKNIAILFKPFDNAALPPYIYDCKDLVKLAIDGFDFNHPPSRFKGFAHLRCLELDLVHIEHDVFESLIASCPRLAVLKLVYWTGLDDLVIDMPSVEHLTIAGQFETFFLKNVQRLSFMSLYLERIGHDDVNNGDHIIKKLASSCQLQELHIGGQMCEFIGPGFISMSPTLNFLHKLHLTEVDLSKFGDFCFTLGMVQCCSFIEELDISISSEKCDVDHVFDYNKKCELRHLVMVKITGLTGSKPELELIEYILSVASKLEILAFKCSELHPISELKVTRDLAELPRASTKAKLVCLEKLSM